MEKNIAVIGGGTAALYLLRVFVLRARPGSSLSIFESGDRFGVGMPYSPEWSNPEHEMNIACQELPELYEEPHVWLTRQSEELLSEWQIERPEISPLSILPRILFGNYQEEQFHALVQQGRSRGLTIRLFPNASVTDIHDEPQQNTAALTVNDNERYSFSHVVIATGHHWPSSAEGVDTGYYRSPYPLHRLTSIRNTSVAIIGSSLSAVDVIRTVARNNGSFFRNQSGTLQYVVREDCEDFSVVMHSRRGLLPSVRYHLEHPRIRRYEYISRKQIEENREQNGGFLSLDYVFQTSYLETIKKQDPATYSQIRDMSIEEFVAYYYEREGLGHAEPFSFLSKQLVFNRKTEVDKTPIYWKEAIEDTIYTLNFHAKSLSAEDSIRLRKHLIPLYYHAVIFMPYQSTEELLALHDTGLLDIVTLGFESRVETSLEERGGTFHFRDTNGEQRLHYDVIVDCRGQRCMPFESFPFQRLIDDGVVSQAQIQFSSGRTEWLRLPGVAISDSFQAVSVNGEPNPRIYIVANAHIKGMNPDLSGIPFCNDMAKIVMKSILSS